MTDPTPITENSLEPQASLLGELEESVIQKITLEVAADLFLEHLLSQLDGVREEDLVQVTITQHGTVSIYTRDRVQRRRDIRPLKRDEVTE